MTYHLYVHTKFVDAEKCHALCDFNALLTLNYVLIGGGKKEINQNKSVVFLGGGVLQIAVSEHVHQ